MNRKPRIVIAGQMPPPYGGQNLNIKRLYELFKESDSYQVEHWKFGFTNHLNEFRKAGLSKLREFVRVLQRLVLLRGRGRIDLLVYPSGGPHRAPAIRDIMLLPFAALASKRVVVHFQAAGVARAAQQFPPWLWKALCFVHGRCWGAIAITAFGKEDPASLGMRNIFVIPNGIEDYNPNAILRKTKENHVVLHAGHLCPDKGTPSLLEAFSRLTKKRNDIHLRLVGECMAPYSADLLAYDIERLELQDKVSWPGLLTGDDLPEEYSRASLLVFPTIAPFEAFGLVLAEAMMWGMPLIVSDWRANAEVAGSDCGGIIYKPGADHVASLAAALSEAFERQPEWPAWGQRNRERYEACYTIERFKSDFESLFARALVGVK